MLRAWAAQRHERRTQAGVGRCRDRKHHAKGNSTHAVLAPTSRPCLQQGSRPQTSWIPGTA
eukprot:8781-Alexandrium_andersonii.AAC.1